MLTNKISFAKYIFAAITLALVSNAAHADQYKIAIDGNLINTDNVPTFFGLPGASNPFHLEFTVDTTLGVSAITSSTVDTNNGSTLPTNATVVQRSAITAVSGSVGTTAFTTNDLVNRIFFNNASADLVFFGNLTNGATGNVYLEFSNGVGQIALGSLQCAPSSVCVVSNTGSGTSYFDGGHGDVANIVATITSLTKSPAEQLTDLETQVKSINLKQGIANSLDSKLQNSRAALDETLDKDKPSAINMLYAFISSVQAQSGKAITTTQAASLIASAQKIIDTLSGN